MVMQNKHAGFNTAEGFTLIEVLVVLAIIATLLSMVAPRYFETVERSKETTLKHDLIGMRDAIDKYYSDTGNYPDTLDDLVNKKYLRTIPEDPITGSNSTWVVTPPVSLEVNGSIYDIHSGSPAIAQDGSNYADW
ncbi:type II secretion system pseudopilin OxpG [Methyloradius palustris]|uniref:Type II secretion system pseudopilin OxpG n=2 Tax=Methyloradius palustris TaxID=2778876 RepID=A0A8D5GF89_9PROT|nr:type II secretion system pseudopilin OxpG [Methyloradius palustris]